MATVGMSSAEEEPPKPEKGDFAIFIRFHKDAERPQRIFRAIEGMITALEKLDVSLAGSIDPSIEPVLLLEDIEAGSIKVWLRDKLKHVEDQSLYELDWRPMVGKYLLRAKYMFIQWVNDEEARKSSTGLTDLRTRIKQLAASSGIRKIPAYGAPSVPDIIDAAEEFGRALSHLDHRDAAEYVSEAGTTSFDLRQEWGDLGLSDLSVKEAITAQPMAMLLTVRRPDYLGDAQWEFRHGKRAIRAKVTDRNWLTSFQSRMVDVRPGDALRCMVVVTSSYGFDNDLISEQYTITEVIDVLQDRSVQSDLFGG